MVQQQNTHMGEDGEVMKLKKKYANQADIPAGFEGLYTEVNGEWQLTEVEGLTSDADVARLNEALRKERNDHKAVKESLSAVTSVLESAGIEVGALGDVLDQYSVLKDGKGANTDTAKLNMELSQLRRNLTDVTKSRDTLAQENEGFKQANSKRTINDALMKAATSAGIKEPSVLEDIQLYSSQFTIDEGTGAVVTREGFMQPEVWLTEMKDKRSHWWPASQGGGGGVGGGGHGSLGVNPFSAKGWNLTEQMKLAKENPQRAEQMAKQAGTTVGGQRPAQ